MSNFEPEPGDVVTLQLSRQNIKFRIDASKINPLFAHELEAGKAIIYRLVRQVAPKGEPGMYALKKFKHQYQDSSMPAICNSLAGFKRIPGLEVCERYCLTDTNATTLLKQYEDLRYGILMPWISGDTWADVRLTEANTQSKWQDPALCLMLAARLAERLAELERRGIAHCDLSPGNMIFNPTTYDTQFIDVEDMYAPGMAQPHSMTAGSPGYQHRSALNGLWCAEGDRFAAAVLIGEMVTFCDKTVRTAKHGEDSYFAPAETQTGDVRNVRFLAMRDALARLHSPAASLFESAWAAPSLVDCPTMAQWGQALFNNRPPLPPIKDYQVFWKSFPTLDTKPEVTEFTPLLAEGSEPKPAGFKPWSLN